MNDTAIRAAAQAVHDWIFSPPDLAPIRGEPSIMQIEAIIKSHDTPAGDLVSREEAAKVADKWVTGETLTALTAKTIARTIRALPTVTPAPAAVWDEAIKIVTEMRDYAERLTLTLEGYERDSWISKIVAFNEILAALQRAQKGSE